MAEDGGESPKRGLSSCIKLVETSIVVGSMLISIISATVLDLYMLYIWFRHAQKQKLVLRYSFNTKIWSGWWFQTFFIFHNIWENPFHWLIFFKIVKTTNQWFYLCSKLGSKTDSAAGCFPETPGSRSETGRQGWWLVAGGMTVDVHIYKINMDKIMIIDELPDKHGKYDQTCILPDSWNGYDPYSKKVDR